MEKGKWSHEPRPARIQRLFAIFLFLFSTFFLPGCGSPGEPIERKPQVPTAIQDLSGEQSGNSVVLTFTLPRDTVERRPLKQAPDIEIYRRISSTASSGGEKPGAGAPSLLVTIPTAMVNQYIEQGHVRYTDNLRPEDWSLGSQETATYLVRSRAVAKRASPESNVVTVRIEPAPEPIDDLKAENDHSAIRLTWTLPAKTPIGPAPPIKIYRVYRAELPGLRTSEAPGAAAPTAVKTSGTSKPTLQLMKIGETEPSTYEDSQVEFGRSYAYAVRSVVDYSGEEVESSDSNVVTITVRDVVAPPAPRGLVVVFMPVGGEAPAHLELSWEINPETDVSGYNVYRTEVQGELGTKLNSELLPTPAFRDMSTAAGHHYFYKVTAVDHSGNESSASEAVSGEMPAESKPEP